MDEAFLRRIQYKVWCASPTREEFIQIFKNYCRVRGVPFDLHVVEDLLLTYFEPRNLPLRGCHPRDLVEHALTLAEYLGEPRALTPALLRAACDSYFVDESDSASLLSSSSHA
jgi:SpoVK/Ycf46/Vps4 family AAA+-type ATPase